VPGVFYLFENGKMVSYYGHKRIRTYTIEGGVTVYSKISFNEQIKKMGENLLSKLNWSGLAMVEFLFDKRVNDYKIIEVNPRLWGSIFLSEFANTKFIRNYINLSIAVKEEKSEVIIK